jgi:hypothetical protein
VKEKLEATERQKMGETLPKVQTAEDTKSRVYADKDLAEYGRKLFQYKTIKIRSFS